MRKSISKKRKKLKVKAILLPKKKSLNNRRYKLIRKNEKAR